MRLADRVGVKRSHQLTRRRSGEARDDVTSRVQSLARGHDLLQVGFGVWSTICTTLFFFFFKKKKKKKKKKK